MKVLLRRWKDETYVWKTAKYAAEGFIVNGQVVAEVNIVSVMNDNRKNYVKCSACGAVIRNNEKAIEKHHRRTETVDSCLTCPFVSCHTNSSVRRKHKFVRHSDGTYTKNTEEVVTLHCSGGWHTHPIGSEEAKQECVFKGCKTSEMERIFDEFIAYPGLFDDIATVNAIGNVGCDLDKGYYNNGYWHYLLKIDVDGIYAAVNELGIIDHFVIKEGYFGERNLYYSNKYDLLFSDSIGFYESYTGLQRETLKANLKKLYN